MGSAIIFKDVNFSYIESENARFEDFSLEIEEGSFTTIVGPNGSGKSTLVKLMVGLLEANGLIKINNRFVNAKNIKTIRKQIGVVFDNPNSQFICDTVLEDIEFALANYGYKQSVIKKKIKAIVDLLKIDLKYKLCKDMYLPIDEIKRQCKRRHKKGNTRCSFCLG
mgnify:CR=1 FL=1